MSTTTFLSTFTDVILTSATGLILSSAFGPAGWIFTVVIVALVIMVFLNLLPKAIGIENSVRMALFLSPGTGHAPEGPLARRPPPHQAGQDPVSGGGRQARVREEELVDEFESLLIMLEKAGEIEPDSGRILRSALASSKTTAGDLLTPIKRDSRRERRLGREGGAQAHGQVEPPPPPRLRPQGRGPTSAPSLSAPCSGPSTPRA